MDKKLNKLVLLGVGLLCVVTVVYIALDVRSTRDYIYELEKSSNTRNISTKANFIEEWEDVVALTREEIEVLDPTTGQVITKPVTTPEGMPNTGSIVSPDSVIVNTQSQGGGRLTTYYARGNKLGVVLTDDATEGWLSLYDGPTVKSNDAKMFNVQKIYRDAGFKENTWKCAMQSFGGPSTEPNNSNKDFANYYAGGGKVRTESKGAKGATAGTMTVNGINRHMIALGPSFLYKVQSWSTSNAHELTSSNMNYGRLVDIKVSYEGNTYYIPCIVVDVKAHTAISGFVQTGVSISTGVVENGNADSTLIEWYGVSNQKSSDGSRSSGLRQFTDVEVILYNDCDI